MLKNVCVQLLAQKWTPDLSLDHVFFNEYTPAGNTE